MATSGLSDFGELVRTVLQLPSECFRWFLILLLFLSKCALKQHLGNSVFLAKNSLGRRRFLVTLLVAEWLE